MLLQYSNKVTRLSLVLKADFNLQPPYPYDSNYHYRRFSDPSPNPGG
jgi:hypothetical protein